VAEINRLMKRLNGMEKFTRRMDGMTDRGATMPCMGGVFPRISFGR